MMLETLTDDTLSFHDISYKQLNMPLSIKACSIKRNCGTVILINNNFNIEAQKKSFQHELIHVMKGHLNNFIYNKEYINNCEKEVNQLL